MFTLPYLFMLLLQGIGDQVTGASSINADYAYFIDAAGNVQQVQISTPTGGAGADAAVTTDVQYPTDVLGWLGSLARFATLGDVFRSTWSQPFRAAFMALAAPGLLMLSIYLKQALSYFIGGIFGAGRSILGLGRG
jgi:hypothetical protein